MKVDWKKPTLIWLCAACLPGLVLGLVSYYWAVGPLEKKLMDREVRGLAKEIDHIISVRATAIRMAANNLDIDNLTDGDALDGLLTGIREVFPDFLSMEIIDEHGEILAMLGELPLSDAARVSEHDNASMPGAVNASQLQVFSDKPSANCFLITVRHKTSTGAKWYTRNRFSRDRIEQVLVSGTGLPVKLLPIATPEQPLTPPGIGSSAGFFSRWSRADVLEACLAVPGWMVKLDRPVAKPPLWRYFVIISLGMIGVFIAAGYALRRYGWVQDRSHWQSARTRSLVARTLGPGSSEHTAVSKSFDSTDSRQNTLEAKDEPDEPAVPSPCPKDAAEAPDIETPARFDLDRGGLTPEPFEKVCPAVAGVNPDSAASLISEAYGMSEPAGSDAAVVEGLPLQVVSGTEQALEQPCSTFTDDNSSAAGRAPALDGPDAEESTVPLESAWQSAPLEEIPEYLELTWLEPGGRAKESAEKK